MYVAECHEKDDQTRSATKKVKSAMQVTLQLRPKWVTLKVFTMRKTHTSHLHQLVLVLAMANTKVLIMEKTKKDEGDTSSPTKKRKRNSSTRPRGMNLVKEVARLKDGEKLGVNFYNNGVIGDNSEAFSRHLGKTVCDGAMCPIRVHSWDEIRPEYLETMWTVVVVISRISGNKIQIINVWGLQLSEVELMAEIQENNDRVDALESNHQKKIKVMQAAHERHMAEMKESH
ncbi:hypothetical protein Cgig2_032323 [Carnegiea gigantea]|uniref:Uncharacterized protein n=1 Tax=Carnegiea gigantea TaxID=171969 RepID=A0A9Q1QKT5_9CARY|nr:hypothetical protein Cgig2_032323 [Carnegiea gigantea]